MYTTQAVMSRSAINKTRYEPLAHDTYSSETVGLSLLADFPVTVKTPVLQRIENY